MVSVPYAPGSERQDLRCTSLITADDFAEYGNEFSKLSIHFFSPSLLRMQLQLWREALPKKPSEFDALVNVLAGSGAFQECFACSRCRTPFLLPRLAFVENMLNLETIAAGLAHARADGDPIKVSIARPDNPEDPCVFEASCMLPFVSTESDLKSIVGAGTVFINMASQRWPALAAACRTANSTLGFPTNINVYATSPGRTVSMPPHTDDHDVLVLQVQGSKRWHVFAPPALQNGMAHPYYRGRGRDVLSDAELNNLLVDVTLCPGECMFVPAGFPHSTSTVTHAKQDVSLGLAFGIWSASQRGFATNTLWTELLNELAANETEILSELHVDFWTLAEPLSVGFIAPEKQDLVSHLAERAESLYRIVPEAAHCQDTMLHEAARQAAARCIQVQKDLLASQDHIFTQVLDATSPNGTVVLVAPSHIPDIGELVFIRATGVLAETVERTTSDILLKLCDGSEVWHGMEDIERKKN